MTEADLIDTIFAIFDRYWNMIQWWGSVSFGLIAVAQFAVDRLNVFLLSLLILLYTLFTAWVGIYYFFNLELLWGFRQDLAELGSMAHHGTKALLTSRTVVKGVILQDVAVVLTFFSSIAYLIFSFFTRRGGGG